MSPLGTPQPAVERQPERQQPPLPTIASEALFVDGPLVCIEHRGQRYYLRRTREDKLLLTK